MRVPRLLAEALGAGTTLSAPLLYPLIDPHHELVFHLHAPAGSLFGGVLLDWLAMVVLVGLLLAAVERRPPVRLLLRCALILACPPILYLGCRSQGWMPTMPLSLLGVYALLCACLLAFLYLRRAQWDALEELARSILLFAGFSALLFAGQFVYSWQKARTIGVPPALQARREAVTPPPGRVVWIVLDELSYEQTFARRAPGLHLPASTSSRPRVSASRRPSLPAPGRRPPFPRC